MKMLFSGKEEGKWGEGGRKKGRKERRNERWKGRE